MLRPRHYADQIIQCKTRDAKLAIWHSIPLEYKNMVRIYLQRYQMQQGRK